MYPAVATAPIAVDAMPGVRPPAPRAIRKATANPAPTHANPITAAGIVPISNPPVIPRPATSPETDQPLCAELQCQGVPGKRIPAIASDDAA